MTEVVAAPAPPGVEAGEPTDLATVSLRQAFWVWLRIACLSFGGPAGQIALMHKVLVEEHRWIEEGAYLRALNFCTLLPGPEAQQLATYVGWKMHGVRGGLVAGGLFILPGALVILALSLLYAYAADLGPVSAAFLGVKGAVLAIVVEALLRVSKRALNAPVKWGIAMAAFVGLFVLRLPFPLIIVLAAAAGTILAHRWPRTLALKTPPPQTGPIPSLGRLAARAVGAVSVWGAIWAAPMVLILLTLGPDHVLFKVGAFFSKLALVTFGGAYAVLSYMAQEAVVTHHWLGAREMVDGLGLAETTPGPLILVTEFVGFLAAFRAPAPFTPLVAGLLGALTTLWVTFSPCFLWIFAGAPFIERLEHARGLQGALAAITATVVGVIANLTLWFGLHVLFTRFSPLALPWGAASAPDLSSLDWRALALSLTAGLLLFRFHAGVMRTLAACVAGALALHVMGF